MINSPITDKHDREIHCRKKEKQLSALSAELHYSDNHSIRYMTKAHLCLGIYSK